MSSPVKYYSKDFSEWLEGRYVKHTLLDPWAEFIQKHPDVEIRTEEFSVEYNPVKRKDKLFKNLLNFLIKNSVIYEEMGFIFCSLWLTPDISLSDKSSKPMCWLVNFSYITSGQPSIYNLMKNNIIMEMKKEQK